jgi:homoserine dehydrogenase
MAGDLIVLKFGSSILRGRADLPTAVHEIYRWYRAGWRVVAVVSAIGKTTEALLGEARALACESEPHATAELLATGERHAAALLGIALDRAGVVSRVVDPREIGLRTAGSALDSEPIDADRASIETLLQQFAVLVVPGFFGYGENGRVQLLGRGGSDLSAIFLASRLQASRCRLLKDVDGVYERDPALPASTPSRRFVSLGYDAAEERAAQLIQPKAVRFLERHAAHAEVAGIVRSHESTVGRCDCVLTEPRSQSPMSVLLLGLGTVGFGVYQRICAMHEHFRVIGALVRRRENHAGKGIPRELLYESHDEVARLQADVVIDALPGLQPSLRMVRHYLDHGVNVVSANKALIAAAGLELASLAARSSAALRYAAAVGGSAPMLETLQREARRSEIRSIAGVLNGTCNYVLDRCVAGLPFSDAVSAAQECGFAEADPSEDLSGRDAARKLHLLAQQAFGQDLNALEIEPLEAATLRRSHAALKANETLRLIARAQRSGDRVTGQIRLEAVAAEDPFAHTRCEWNRLLITHASGEEVVVSGRGAGRWPTTEAVMADLFDLHDAAAGEGR